MRGIAAGLVLLTLGWAALPAVAQSPAPVVPPPADAAIAAAVDPVATAIVNGGRVPGLAIAVERHGAIVFARGYGFADVARKIPVTVDTRFEIGSVTKQVTAACVLQLVRAKKISLEDHLGTYLSNYFVGRGVTIRQLLEQVSGIPEYLEGDDLPGAAARPIAFAALLDRIAAKPLEFPPGSRWAYSNSNYAILGRIVELASHESYEAYVREHVFAPAGMTESGFIDDEPTLPLVARGYRTSERGLVVAPPLDAGWAIGSGSIVSSIGDVVKWNVALLSGAIVPAADVAEMRTSATLVGGAKSNYGYGWILDTLGGHPRVWHNGATFGYYALNSTFPNDGESIVVLANAMLPAAESLTRDAFAASHPDVAAIAAPTAAPGEDPAITARARAAFVAFQANDIDRTKFTDAMSRALTPDKLAALAAQIRPLGTPPPLIFVGKTITGAIVTYTYRLTFGLSAITIQMSVDGENKIAGYVLRPA